MKLTNHHEHSRMGQEVSRQEGWPSAPTILRVKGLPKLRASQDSCRRSTGDSTGWLHHCRSCLGPGRNLLLYLHPNVIAPLT